MTEVVKELEKIGAGLKEAKAQLFEQLQKQQDEIKTVGATSEATAAAIKAAEQSLEQVGADFKGMDERLVELEKSANRPGAFGGGAEVSSPGQVFVNSDEFKALAGSGRVSCDAVNVGAFFKELSPLTSGANSGGALVQPFRDMSVHRDPGRRAVHLRDIMGVNETTSNAVEFIQHVDDHPVAGAQDGEMGAKKQSEMKFVLRESTVKTIAHWIPASRQILDDAPQARVYIDGELMHGLLVNEDAQILYGDGTDGTLTGIFNTNGVQDAGFIGDRNMLDHIRRAVRMGRESEYPMDAVLLSPADWEAIETLKGSDDQYLWVTMANVAAGAEPRVWRVPVVETNAVNDDEFLVGNFDMGARIWDRSQSTIRVADQHADFFIKNGVVILAEERLALTVNRPKAFVKGSFAQS